MESSSYMDVQGLVPEVFLVIKCSLLKGKYSYIDLFPIICKIYSKCRFCSRPFTLASGHESIHLCNNAVQTKYANAERSSKLPPDNMWDQKVWLYSIATLWYTDLNDSGSNIIIHIFIYTNGTIKMFNQFLREQGYGDKWSNSIYPLMKRTLIGTNKYIETNILNVYQKFIVQGVISEINIIVF